MHRKPRTVYFAWLGLLVTTSFVSAQTLRVVTYNIDADTGGAHGQPGGDISGPGLSTVLQAIGNFKLADHAQPIDVLALQELNYASTATTLGYITDQLNAVYGANTYAYAAWGSSTGDFVGNGPNGLVYRTTTVQVLDATQIGFASGSGAPRTPMKYTLAPVGINDGSANVTLYVSHAKASSGSGNEFRRNAEAQSLRDDALSLGDHAHIIYSGDFNISSSGEAAYQTLVAPGKGQGFDPKSPNNNWTAGTNSGGLLTEAATQLFGRYDFQLVSAPMLNENGMRLVDDSYTTFGNNGSISVGANVNTGSNSALNQLANKSQVLAALTTATDHLPVVADYTYKTDLVPLLGDYDNNKVVDLSDYVFWKAAFGTNNPSADGNGNGVVDSGDYTIWRDNFHPTAAGAGGGSLTAAVPEPPTIWLSLLAVVGVVAANASRVRGKIDG